MELDGNTIGLLSLAVAAIGRELKNQTRMKELEIRLTVVEKQDDVILSKLDKILDEITNIKIDLQNKQDKI